MNLWVIHQNEKTNKKWKIEPKSQPWIIGTSKESQLRIPHPNSDEQEIYGTFSFQKNQWIFTNLCNPNSDTQIQRSISIDGATDIKISNLTLKVIPLNEKVEILSEENRKKLSDYNLIQKSLKDLKKLQWHHLFEKEAAPFLGGALAISCILIVVVFIGSQQLRTQTNSTQTGTSAASQQLVTRTIELQKHNPIKSKTMTQAMKNVMPPQHPAAQNSTSSTSRSKFIIGSIFNKIQGKSLDHALKTVSINAQSKNLIAGVLTKNINALSKSLPDKNILNASAQGATSGVGNGLGTGINTIGSGSGGTGSASYGSMDHGDVGKAHIGLMSDESDVQGGLDRTVIASYIQSQLGPILFCYERQLSANPQLFGKVAVKFSIKGDGLVDTSEISETTLKSKSVETCLLSQINKWKFPKPQGGTKVVVTYPFMFKSVN